MKAQVKKIDFSNQNIYCGVDVHKKRWQVTMCTEHTVQKSLSFERPFVDMLKLYLEKHYPGGNYYIAYEAGFCGIWPQKALEAARMKTLIASKRTKSTQGRLTKTKTPAIGVIQRGGKIIAIPVVNTTKETIKSVVSETVKPGSIVFTDAWHSYSILDVDYIRYMIKHSVGEYVSGSVHTNNLENFWNHLKRGIVGIYHNVSDRHLRRYVKEFTFRYNNCKLIDGS